MDFKVTGTAEGVTALQMDIKITGITPAIMREALAQARQGRLHILGKMAEALPGPRDEISPRAPRIMSVRIPVDKIGTVIGPGGKQIRELEALGCTVEVAEDGQLADLSPAPAGPNVAPRSSGEAVKAVLAGNVFKVNVAPGDRVEKGQPLLVVEAMKMETAVSAPSAGTISDVFVREGDVVAVGDPLVAIAG